MSDNSMDDDLPLQEPPGISRWEFEEHTSQIRARDRHGRVLMAIPVDPLFGPRLAAAFNAPDTAPQPKEAADTQV